MTLRRADPRWRRPLLAAGLAVAMVAWPGMVASGHAASAPPRAVSAATCGGRYHQFTFGHEGILILRQRGVACPEARRIARSLALGPRRRFTADGLRCRPDLRIQAGGGAELCTAPRRILLLGFE
jgi:hypothetical protein